MGLFNDVSMLGGHFYREFSQASDKPCSNFIRYFSQVSVAKSGICAGASLYWIKHYLTGSGDYTNINLRIDAEKIIIAQKALRHQDKSLQDILVKSGLKPRKSHYFDYDFSEDKLEEVAVYTCGMEGVNVISYSDPNQGRHVVTTYTNADKYLYFSDVNKGDVKIPYPRSVEWLTRYFQIFCDRCGTLTISHFQDSWSQEIFKKIEQEFIQDAMKYNFNLRTRSNEKFIS